MLESLKDGSALRRVAWTDEAFADDAGYRSMTKLGYVALMVVLAAVVGFAAYVVYAKWGR